MNTSFADGGIENIAYVSLSSKLQEQRDKMLSSKHDVNTQLFENTSLNILASKVQKYCKYLAIKKVRNIREWNEIMVSMLNAEEKSESQNMQFSLIRNRRLKK